MGNIVVQVSKQKWTMEAIQLACAMAQNTHSRLVLLHLMEVRSPYLLGAEVGVMPPSEHELDIIREAERTAETYGLEITLQRMEYVSFTEALVQAAELTRPTVIFANVPENIFSFWGKFQQWNLRRQLTALGCQLYTPDKPEVAEAWIPSLRLKATK